MPNVTKNIAIIVAAGKSLRMQGIDKIETMVGGKPLINYTLRPFLASEKISDIVIVCNSENKKRIAAIFPKKIFPHIHTCLGGESRFQSAEKGFQYAEKHLSPQDRSAILFHNCGNVLATKDEMETSIVVAQKTGACIVARLASDTLKRIDPVKNIITETVDRSHIIHAETPQTFQYKILKKAYKEAKKKKTSHTDESSLVESIGQKVSWIPASTFNRKITTQHDLQLTKMILAKEIMTQVKIVYGLGTDTHHFEKFLRGASKKIVKKSLTLCGVVFPKYPKLAADSDGDVAIHALATAISQGIGQGSLGTFATALCKKGVTDSKKYLIHILNQAREKHARVTHVGLNFECVSPKIDPMATRMKKSLARLLDVEESDIGITATTGEKKENSEVRCTAIVTLQISPA